MTRFVLTAIDGGRLILSTEEPLRADEYVSVRRAVDEWRKSDEAILVIADCVVRRSSADLEIEIEPAPAEIPYPSAAEARHERLLEEPFASRADSPFANRSAPAKQEGDCSNCGTPYAEHFNDCGEFG